MRTSEPLFGRLLEVLRGAAGGALLHVFIAAEPAPASRPRFSKWGGIYYSKSYEEFYAACQTQLAQMKTEIAPGRFIVALEFVCTKARTSKLTTPKGDVDNYAKGPMDAVTKAEKIWKDDSAVTELVVSKRFAAKGEAPGVNIHYAVLEQAE